MKKRTIALQFDRDIIRKIMERDNGKCIFCSEYGIAPHDNRMLDICHVVNKSQGGLGIEQNGVVGCRYHHHLLDNSSQNKEFRDFAESYLKSFYPDWNKKNVTYDKWVFLKGE